MSPFDEAARKAAESIERSKRNAPDEWFLIPITEMTEIIAKHHSDLRATYEKLVELANSVGDHYEAFGGDLYGRSDCKERG